MGDPVGGENDKETQDSGGKTGFAGFGGFGVTPGGKHLKAAHNQHAKEDEAGEDKDVF